MNVYVVYVYDGCPGVHLESVHFSKESAQKAVEKIENEPNWEGWLDAKYVEMEVQE